MVLKSYMMLLPDQMQGFQLSSVGKDKNWSWKRVRSNGLVSIQSKFCSLNIGETDRGVPILSAETRE